MCSADLQLAFRLGRFNNLTNALVYSLKFAKEAMNLSYKKDSVQGAKLLKDQCQTGDVVVKELIVKKVDTLFQCLVTNKKATKISVVDSSVSNKDIIK